MSLIGLGMLAHGLAGYGNFKQQQRDNARQDKLDAAQAARDERDAERFTWDRERIDAERRQRQDREAIDKAVTEGMDAGKVKDAAAVSYTDADGTQKTAFQPDLQTAQFAADQQRLEESITPPAVPSAPKAEAGQGASVRTLDGARRLFSGLTAASDAKKFADENPATPYAKYMALSERLAGMAGGQEKADAYLKRAKEAEKEGAFRTITLLDANQHEAAAKAFNSVGNLRLQPGQKFVTVTNEDGSKVHRLLNVDGSVAIPDVQQALLMHIAGPEGMAAQAASDRKLKSDLALKKWEFANDPSKRYVKLNKGVLDTKTNQIIDNDLGMVPALDANGQPIFDEDGNQRMVPGSARMGAGAGAGTGSGANKGGGSSVIKDTLKDNAPNIAPAHELAAMFKANNPGMPDAAADALGVRAASGANRTLQFDVATGKWNEFFHDKPQVDDKGKPTGFSTGKSWRLQSHDYVDGGAVPKEEAQKAVAAMQQQLPKAQFDSYVASVATPEAYKAFNERAQGAFSQLVEKAKADVAAVQKDQSLTPQQRVERLNLIQASLADRQQEMQAEKRRVDIMRQFYKSEPDKPKVDKPAAPTLTDRLKTPGGFGAAVPSDAAQRAAAEEQATAKRAADAKAQKEAEAAADQQARKDINGLTPDVIRNINDLSVAQQLYTKYNLQLNGFQREALQRRIDILRNQARTRQAAGQ